MTDFSEENSPTGAGYRSDIDAHLAELVKMARTASADQSLRFLQGDLGPDRDDERNAKATAFLLALPIATLEDLSALLDAEDASRYTALLSQDQEISSEAARAVTDSLRSFLNASKRLPADAERAVILKTATLGEFADDEIVDTAVRDIPDFESLGELDANDLRQIVRKLPSEILATALKGASEPLCDILYAVMTTEDRGELMQELERSGPASLSEIESAQSDIVELARELEP